MIVRHVRHEARLASLTWIPLPTDLRRCKIGMADTNRAVEEPDHDVSSTAGVSINGSASSLLTRRHYYDNPVSGPALHRLTY